MNANKQAVIFNLKPNGDGRFYFECHTYKSSPFEFKNMRENKEMFSKLLFDQGIKI